jgi:phosphoribosyl 1,2-cyclic phosphodiesterase
VRVWMCGVRGSTSAPGAEFARVGGHTSCVAVAHDGAPPTLLLDAGTGLRRVTEILGDAPFHGTVLLTHLHWDHTEGLPFFRAGDRADAHTTVVVPRQGRRGALALLSRTMSPPNFPITPRQLRGDWAFRTVDEGHHRIEGFDVLAAEIPHKGGRTFGYRVRDAHGRTLAYLPDHAPHALGTDDSELGRLHEAALALTAGVDLLVHDAQYTRDELPSRAGFGHSAAPYAAVLASAAGARRVLLSHHDPARTDDAVEAIARRVAADHPMVLVDGATEGMVIDL